MPFLYKHKTNSHCGTKTTDRRELINADKNKHIINNLYIGKAIIKVLNLLSSSVKYKDYFAITRNDDLFIILKQLLSKITFKNSSFNNLTPYKRYRVWK